jgi:hypothetical protein
VRPREKNAGDRAGMTANRSTPAVGNLCRRHIGQSSVPVNQDSPWISGVFDAESCRVKLGDQRDGAHFRIAQTIVAKAACSISKPTRVSARLVARAHRDAVGSI